MFNNQANNARFIYTLNYLHRDNNTTTTTTSATTTTTTSINNNNTQVQRCMLKNGFVLSKESRSDEKLRYTEHDLRSIIRTVLFIHVFEMSPNESLVDIINTGQVSYDCVDGKLQLHNKLNIAVAMELLDSMFGKNFSVVTKKELLRCYEEYAQKWHYYPFITGIVFPSAADYIRLSKFVNISVPVLSEPIQFILRNSTDFKVPLQNNVKIFK